jgi:hypothetical protein
VFHHESRALATFCPEGDEQHEGERSRRDTTR